MRKKDSRSSETLPSFSSNTCTAQAYRKWTSCAEHLRGTLPLLILSVLGNDELYGYEISQRIRERSGDLFAPSEGSLYPALHRLERDGALSATARRG